LASFSISKANGTQPAAISERAQLIRQLRMRGWRGGLIKPHRAFARVKPTAGDFAACTVLVAGFGYAWVRLLPTIGEFWRRMFEFWSAQLHLGAAVLVAPQHWGPHMKFGLPLLNLPAGGISPFTWVLTAFVTFGVFAATSFISQEHLPWIYILRALVLIQTTALVYFAFAAARFPHDLPTYTVGMLSFGVILIGLVPPILAFTYYLFDFSFAKKFAITCLTVAHLVVFIPLQYMLHVYILHHSILFMPLLYFALGPFLDVLVFVSFYSWAMSWQSRNDVEAARARVTSAS
jgi:hypothetical protein